MPKRVPLFDTTADLTLRIQATLAAKIGFNEAVVLMQLEYLITISEEKIRQGNLWTYQSLEELKKNSFPWWSTATISRVLKSLEAQGLILIDNFNQRREDRTHWFSLNFEKIRELGVISLNDSHSIFQNEKRSRENEPETAQKPGGILQNERGIFHNERGILQDETTLPKTPTKTPTKKELSKDNGVEPHQPLEINSEETLLPDTPELLHLFEKINHNRKLKNRGPVKRFQSHEQKRCCLEAIARLGHEQFTASLKKGLEKGITDLSGLISWMAKWGLSPRNGSKRGQKPTRASEPGIIEAAQRASGDSGEWPDSPGSGDDPGTGPGLGTSLLAGY